MQELRRFRLDSTLPVLYDLSGIGGTGGSAAWARGGCHATETSGRAVGGCDGGRPGRRGGAGERRWRVGAAPAEPGPGRPGPVQREGPRQPGVRRLRARPGQQAAGPGRPASQLQAAEPQPALLRGHRAARHPLHLRLRRHLRRRRVRAEVLLDPLQAGQARAPDRAPAAVQRPGPQRPRGDQQPPHRRPDGRALAGPAPAGRGRHPPEHDLLRQLVRAAGLQVPRLHQDRRARPGHRLQLRGRA